MGFETQAAIALFAKSKSDKKKAEDKAKKASALQPVSNAQEQEKRDINLGRLALLRTSPQGLLNPATTSRKKLTAI